MELLDRMLEHDRWATTRLLELARDLPDEQLDKQFDIGHRTLRATFEHMNLNIGFWTGVMRGQQMEIPSSDSPVTALVDRHEQIHAAFASFARQIRDDQRLDDTFVDYYGENMMFGGAIVHVILHNAEHRTEVLHILERLGVPNLPELDHALWDLTARGL